MPLVLRTSQANLDLVEIALHIAEDNPSSADQWLDTLEEKCRLLATMPTMGRRRLELALELRSFPFGDCIIFYRPVRDGVEIIRVLHGARDLQAFFK